MPSNMFSITWHTCMVWRAMPFEKNQIVAMGAKLDIRIEWFKQFWMSMLPLSLKPRLDSIWRRGGKRWSLKDIKMATYYIFQWNRYSIYECPWCPRLIQVHCISTFNPPRFSIFPYYGFQRLISCRKRSQIWRQCLQNVVDGDYRECLQNVVDGD